MEADVMIDAAGSLEKQIKGMVAIDFLKCRNSRNPDAGRLDTRQSENKFFGYNEAYVRKAPLTEATNNAFQHA